MMTAAMTTPVSVSHPMGWAISPRFWNMPLRMPLPVAKMKVKIMPEMEDEMTVGMKNTPRKKDDPRSF